MNVRVAFYKTLRIEGSLCMFVSMPASVYGGQLIVLVVFVICELH